MTYLRRKVTVLKATLAAQNAGKDLERQNRVTATYTAKIALAAPSTSSCGMAALWGMWLESAGRA